MQQIVIFFTDGEPNHQNGFDDDVAIEAVNVAHDMKVSGTIISVSYTHLRAHETRHDLVCRLLLEKKKKKIYRMQSSD